MADRDYLKPANAFLDWFKSWPGTTFHNDIEIVDLRARGAGRGIVAKVDIEPDTVLFTIPRKAVICSTTSDLATLIPSIVQGTDSGEGKQADGGDGGAEGDEETEGQDPWTSLILIMIYEFLRGDKSPWKPYFDVLPAVFDTPMFWSADELKELQASPVVDRVGREEADEMIKTKVLPVIREHSSIFFADGTAPLADESLLQLAHRMGSTIMAYSFSLEKDDDDDSDDEGEKQEGEDVEMKDGDDEEEHEHEHEHGPGCNHDHGDDDSDGPDGWVEDKDDQLPLGMVPMADMLNADAEFNAHINHGVDALTATSVRPIKAGEEILNYYGPLSNGELLRRYGYTTEKHEFFDAVDLPWELVQEHLSKQLGIKSAEASKVLEALDPDELDPIMLDRDFDEDEITGHLNVPASGRVLSELPPILRRQARAFVKVALKRQQKQKEKELSGKKGGHKAKGGKEDKSSQKSEKEIVTSAIATAISARLAAYPTTLEQDVAQFESLSAGGGSQSAGRLHSALRVRIGEKRLLREAVALAKEAAEAEKSIKGKKNDRRGDVEEQPSGKRQKTRH